LVFQTPKRRPLYVLATAVRSKQELTVAPKFFARAATSAIESTVKKIVDLPPEETLLAIHVPANGKHELLSGTRDVHQHEALSCTSIAVQPPKRPFGCLHRPEVISCCSNSVRTSERAGAQHGFNLQHIAPYFNLKNRHILLKMLLINFDTPTRDMQSTSGRCIEKEKFLLFDEPSGLVLPNMAVSLPKACQFTVTAEACSS